MAHLVVVEVALGILFDPSSASETFFIYLLEPPGISRKQDLHITLCSVSPRYARGGSKEYHSRPLSVRVISPFF
jgi:hypothetical protein